VKLFSKLTLVILIILIISSGCVWKKGIILFNTEQITKENALYNQVNFNTGQRIYYLFIAPEEIKSPYIRVQVFKVTDTNAIGGAEVVRTNDYRLMKDERYYHSDYFVIHQKGRYGMQVFSMDNLQYPMAIGQFYVK